MKLAYPIKISADLSQTSLEDAWEQAFKPKNFSLIVGVHEVSNARTLKLKDADFHVWVNPDWSNQWMVSSVNKSVFSESAG